MKNDLQSITYEPKQPIFDVLDPKNTTTHPTQSQQFHTLATFFYTIGVVSK
jgi:hypothetical protein